MKTTENNKTRITLEEAKKTKSKSNFAKIVADQRKELLDEKKKK